MPPESTLEIIESMNAEQATRERLFAREGHRVHGTRRLDPDTVREGLRIIEAALAGDARGIVAFKEAMTTSDFSNLFGAVIDRQLLAGYAVAPTTFENYVRVAQVRDFRTVERYKLDGAEGVLTEVPEQTEYPEASIADSKYSYKVTKFGRRLAFSWEAWVNDDLGAFMTVVERFGRAARRSEERYAADLLFDANGPDATFFSAGNGNMVTANPALTIASLQLAMQLLGAQTDADGEPISAEVVHLVVPPALEITALNILNAIQLELTTEGGGTAATRVIAQNWMRNRLRLWVNPYIPKIASTTNGNTSWVLIADPNDSRPAAEVGFLRGNREPAVFVKDPTARRIGGGTDPFDGDFDTDTIEYKVRHVFGGTLMDPKAAVGSQGDGT